MRIHCKDCKCFEMPLGAEELGRCYQKSHSFYTRRYKDNQVQTENRPGWAKVRGTAWGCGEAEQKEAEE